MIKQDTRWYDVWGDVQGPRPKKHDARWDDLWGDVREPEIEGRLYFDFVLWADHHYVQQTVSAEQLERNPDLYGRIFEMLIDRVNGL